MKKILLFLTLIALSQSSFAQIIKEFKIEKQYLYVGIILIILNKKNSNMKFYLTKTSLLRTRLLQKILTTCNY